MHRLAVIVLLPLSAACTLAQVTQSTSSSDPLAVSLAQKSVAVLTGGASVSDVTLSANVISVLGSGNETGTGTLEAKGTGESRVDLSLSGGSRSDVRNIANGGPAGAWSKNGSAATAYAQHNAWSDAAWFFPASSSLSQTATPQFVFSYIGQEQHNGATVQHISTYQLPPSGLSNSPIARLSAMDFYLDSVSYLPVAVAFNLHSDTNMGIDIPVEIRFANYQLVSGVQVPFHFQRLLNGSLVLDVTVTSAAINTGLQDSLFTLQ